MIRWLHEHPLTVTIFFAIVTSLISMFAVEVRYITTKWPRYKLTEIALIRAQARLRLLNHLKDSSYRLLIWFFLNIISIAGWSVAIYVATLLVMSWIKIFKPSFILTSSPWSFAVGLVAGRLVWMHEVLMQLDSYPHNARRLLNFICQAELNRQNDPKHPSVMRLLGEIPKVRAATEANLSDSTNPESPGTHAKGRKD